MRLGPYENEFQRLAGAVVLFSFSLEQTKFAALAVVSRCATSLGAMRIEWVVSVNTKKKELVGNFKNGGQELQLKGSPEKTLVHDFPTDSCGKAIPYGVYEYGAQRGVGQRR